MSELHDDPAYQAGYAAGLRHGTERAAKQLEDLADLFDHYAEWNGCSAKERAARWPERSHFNVSRPLASVSSRAAIRRLAEKLTLGTSCTCGYGGVHEDRNVNCDLYLGDLG